MNESEAANGFHTASSRRVRECASIDARACDRNSSSSQSLIANPITQYDAGSIPRAARLYRAGMIFFVARSPLAPNTTMAWGLGARSVIAPRFLGAARVRAVI